MGLQTRHITGNENLTHYFLCNYIPQSKGSDRLSKSLLGFKKGLSPHKQAWIDCSYSELKDKVDLSGFLILRALGSDEQNPSLIEKPLDELGKRLSELFNGAYIPSLLCKIKVLPRMKQLTREERQQALSDAYRFQSPKNKVTGILILDDILTTGSTLNSIVKAIRHVLPATPINVFTLAFTDYDEHPNEAVTLVGNAYSWEMNDGWTFTAEYPEFYNPPAAVLIQQILTNAFTN